MAPTASGAKMGLLAAGAGACFLLSPSAFVGPSCSPALRSSRDGGQMPAVQSEAVGSAAPSSGTRVVGMPAAAAAAAAAMLLAASRRREVAKPRGSLVAARDGASKGDIKSGASSSLDTSGKIPFVKLTRGADEAIVYLLGASVTSYKTNGTEWMGVRADAIYDGSRPISGGLPICWPQFGPGEVQQHGFARNLEWKLLEQQTDSGVCVMELRDTEQTRAMWPHSFRCEYRVELQEGKLATTFTVENTSASEFNFSTALHSYFKVSDINTCSIRGEFKGAAKLDKAQTPHLLTTGDAGTLKISKFTEEHYRGVLPGTAVLTDPTKGDLGIMSGGGWRDLVIWSPYGDEVGNCKDKMGSERFVCIESAQVAPIPLAMGGKWTATLELVPKPNK
eukprot:CAMPEP_0115074434 /NCGR_PEP_ID=MMETSP0227-20121206/15336_1 /TAXON_ID=89957 /ORGANISM="Polarella glacialis, Strain CCMP 1383" /LENGTH=391 /DNA_ID=CAMNT_0002461397 /DNA_START=64 /DNA_END=1239 /DNA_ORIENTATION=-